MPKPAKRLITPEDLYEFRLIRECRISPDGRFVLYTLERFDKQKRRAFQNLWIVATEDAAEPRPFTVGDHRDSAPRWSPDGKRVCFLSDRLDKKTKLFVIPFDGGEAQRVTDLDGDYAHPCWSPDGRHIAFEFTAKDAIDDDHVRTGENGKDDVVYRHITRLSYKADGKGWLPRERKQIWVVDLQAHGLQPVGSLPVRPLTSGPFDHFDPCWSPDGDELVCCANRNPDPELDSYRIDLWRVALADGKLTRIPTPAGPKEKPSWSPDGKRIAYIGHDDPDCGWGEKNNRLWIVRPDGSEHICLTADLDRPVGNLTIGDLTGLTDAVPPVWLPDDNGLLFQVSSKGETLLHRQERDKPTRHQVSEDETVTFDLSISNVRGSPKVMLAFACTDTANTTILRVKELGQGGYCNTVAPDTGIWMNFDTIAAEPTEIGPDNAWPMGWIIKPLDYEFAARPSGYDPNGRNPAILVIHGGPRTQYGHSFMHEFQCLAAAGYIVMYTNPRGSQGYGEAHAAAIRDGWGTVDYDDLMAAADYLAGLPEVDAKRLGVIGGSYGGYMVNWIIGHTDRFAAAVTDRCVSNLVSFFGSSDIGWELRREFFRRWPWQETAKLWERSPIAYADNFKTPTLIVHSENDDRCPLEQAQQMFTALQARSVPSEMLVFPEESHGMSRGGRPDRRVARLKKILEWFDRFLKT